jgi:tetratricopeptide (TPR) repeat protein
MTAAGDPFQQALSDARQGRFVQALDALGDVLARSPDRAEALALKAAILTETGAPEQALPLFERALSLTPLDAQAHSNLGNALARLGQPSEAVASYGRALAIAPDYALALCNRAGQLVELDRPDEARVDAGRAITLSPRLPAAHRHLSLAQLALGQPEAALKSVEAALALDPHNPDALAHIGSVLGALGRYDEGRERLERAVALRPADAENQYRLALARLRHGAFEAGWQAHDHRWRSRLFRKVSSSYPDRIVDRLDLTATRADLLGHSVLVIDEQGIGDHIMFASMLPDLVAAAAQVTWLAEPRLLGLLTRAFPEVRFLPAGAATRIDLGAFDRMLATGGLGRLFRNRAEDFPGTPYLAPDAKAVEAWRRRLGPSQGRLRIGLSWRGGAKVTGSAARSIDLALLAPLLNHPGCEFVSLQYGPAQEELSSVNAALDRPIIAFPASEIDDFDQLGALTRALDGVVSVQTALVHLCGAIGQDCLAMIPSAAEWRYGERGAAMPWYRSVQLLRQTTPGSWNEVIEAAASQMAARASGLKDDR